MNRLHLLLLLLLFVSTSTVAQEASERRGHWTTISLTPDLLPTVKADDAVGLKLDLERFEALRETRPKRTSMALPFPDGAVDLRLQRFDVRSDAFEVAVTGLDGFRSVEPRTRIVTYEVEGLSLIHICRCGRRLRGRYRWSPYL